MKKIKIVFNYSLGEENEDFKFEDISGERIGEMVGQESSLELINSFDELEEEALMQLVDEDGKVVKEKKIKIEF